MLSSQFQSEATTVARALHYGCVTPSEVVDWVDAWIALSSEPPVELFDLSLRRRDPSGAMVPALERLGGEQPLDAMVPETLGLLGKILDRHPDRLDAVCAALTALATDEVTQTFVPDDLRYARYELEEIREESYGGEPELRARLSAGLNPFVALASAAV